MAHVGKFYKLWFRRDLACNINNNRNAFAEAYQLTLLNLLGSVGSLLNGFPILCTNTDKSPGSTRKWTSAPIATALNAKVQFEITNDVNDGWTFTVLRVFDSIGVLLFQGSFSEGGPRFHYEGFGPTSGNLPDLVTAQCHQVAGAYGASAPFADWNVYNP